MKMEQEVGGDLNVGVLPVVENLALFDFSLVLLMGLF